MPDWTSALGRAPPRSANPPTLRAAERPRNDPVARAERIETRWRDIQWVDFTSEPDGGTIASPISAAALPNGSTGDIECTPPKLGGVLHRFAAPAARDPRSEAIPGLPSRFVRLPVAKLEVRWTASRAAPPRARPSEPATPGAPPPSAGSVVLQPRIAVATGAEAAPDASSRPSAVTSRLRATRDDPKAFPASIPTPVSPSPPVGRRAARGGWRLALAQLAAATGGAGRDVFATAASAATAGVARARTKLQQQMAGDTPAAKRAARIGRRIDRLLLFVASRENRLRVSGMAVPAALLVALAAYFGGTLLTAVTQTGRSASPSNVEDAVAKQLALADRAGHPSRAATPTPPQGNSLPVDPVARAAFYLARAKAGDAAAQYDVGVLYARGEGLVQDYASAATWFRAAAAQGSTAAQYNLGVLYARGLGVAADPAEALNWYRSAADQNFPAAQFNLALAFAAGDGTGQDYAAAARWYQRAAAQGLGPAMVNLAILYEAGNGVERSPVDACAWYSAAGERGDAAAKTRAGELFKQFNERDKARAQGLAATIGAALDSSAPKLPPA